jgi:hypothetical protein
MLLKAAILSCCVSLAIAQQLEVLAAHYGAGTTTIDVTDRVRALIRDNRLEVTAGVAALGSDPVPGVVKTLRVRYRYQGREQEASVPDSETLRLPEERFSINDLFSSKPIPVAAASAAAAGPPGSAGRLRIVLARYGAANKFADVRGRLAELVKDDRVSLVVTNQTMGGDPVVGKSKSLEVRYEFDGRPYQVTVAENKMLAIPEAAVAATAATLRPGAAIPPLGVPGGLRIFYARFGTGGTWVDVRERLRPLLQSDRLTVRVSAEAMGGDPQPGVAKSLHLIYEFRGRTFEKIAAEGETVVLP